MMHAKSDSDMTSLASSSPISPKRHVYYVQSPSRDSNDGDKSSTMQAATSYNSPMDSPSYSSYDRYWESSASRFSGTFKYFSGSKGNGRKRSYNKGWPQCNVIDEERDFDSVYGHKGISKQCQIFISFLGFFVVFSFFCLIIWGASRPYKAQISVKSLNVHTFFVSSGSDATGVPTKMLTVNCSLSMNVYNPATFFGIHVSSIPVNLMYLQVTVATGELRKYHQPRKSNRIVHVNLQGNHMPLYGAGASIAFSDNMRVPVTLVFIVRSQGNVIGKLVTSKHRRHISCSLVINTNNSYPIKLKGNLCKYK